MEAGSALSKEMKMSTLSEEIARRLRNTSLRLDCARRLEILEKACTKMKTSGHTEDFIRQAVKKGVRAFDDKVKRSCLEKTNPGYQPLFPKAGWRRELRNREKAMKRSTWYKGKDKKEPWDGLPKSRSEGRIVKKWKKKKIFQKDGSKMKAAATVICLPSTRGSILLKSLKDDEDKMAEVTGFRV
jgi:hypothetical protein